jgi:hypothetical protein
MAISFKTYVERARVLNTPAGDFIADARLDKSFPDARTWDELKAYLLSRWGTDPIDAAEASWRNYKAFQRKSDRS